MTHCKPTIHPLPSADTKTSLRRLSDTDAPAIHAAFQDRALVRWLAALPVPVERSDSDRYLRFLLDPDVEASAICLGARLIGVVSLSVELSFWIECNQHRKGIGGWAITQFLKQPPKDRASVIACCMYDNLGAKALLQKLGFQRDPMPVRRFSFAHRRGVDFTRYRLNTALPSTL